MAKPTFNELLQLAAGYSNEQIGDSPYTGDNLVIANHLRDGINIAYRKIAREYYRILTKETVRLDDNSSYDTRNFTNKLFAIDKIEDESRELVGFFFDDDNTIRTDEIGAQGIVTIFYYYIPDKLVNDDDVTDFKEGIFEEECLAFYGAYHYLTIRNDRTAGYWANMFNDVVSNIRPGKGESKKVKSRTRW